jgi:hypothetical protein
MKPTIVIFILVVIHTIAVFVLMWIALRCPC